MSDLIKELRADSHRRRNEREYRKAYSTATNDDASRSRIKRADKVRSNEVKHIMGCYDLSRMEAQSVLDGMRIK